MTSPLHKIYRIGKDPAAKAKQGVAAGFDTISISLPGDIPQSSAPPPRDDAALPHQAQVSRAWGGHFKCCGIAQK